jgi:ribosome biogenesis GTP-binding protein YsxC/EngB
MAVVALAKRLSESFFRSGSESLGRVPFPVIGSCSRELHGFSEELKQEGFIGSLIKRSFATRSTQLRRLAKQPVKRDGSRPIGDRATSTGRKTTTTGSASPVKAFRKPWEAKRNAAPRSRPVQKLDRFQDLQLRRQGYEDVDSKAADAAPVKRKRRVMRWHPSDQTNKRIVDDSPIVTSPAKSVEPKKAAQIDDGDVEDALSSQNAQFRAIQPLPEILRHIDTHLLGRRRLWEWRKGGYHPKVKAPLDDVPHGSKEGRLPIQETVFKHKLTFVAAAKVSTSLPSLSLPEVAFAGRSNVGKSSLINALTRQWGVVRTSDKPGMTQSVNFFTLGSRLCLVDLPGYGFAYAKEHVKEAWDDLVKEYVTTRNNLKRVCLLVDSKWGLKPRDEELIHLMENAQTKYQVVLTKTDILSPLDLARRATQIQEALKHHRNFVLPVVLVSSQTGGGLPHLRKALINLAVTSIN